MRAVRILPADQWHTAIHSVTLDYDRRYRRRLRFVTDQGTEILLDLPEAVHIRGGDALALEDGSYVEVRAADEALLEITAPTADALIRLAWHLGNRHLAVQFLPSCLRILEDHVIADMVRKLGGSAAQMTAPFDPEGGAYHSHG
ncbi:urease accessory protein UreE [Acidocella aquatica]|uniref:Urease accessory protein UreE n=1 Tax=Acidocella aquatica TaxID=1922313 RepID=A0ABQ6A8V7_9PROT|nr:urease accessory protein UreE [Acidocella aquatica]GLR68616.1 urease accessory protein UreE [Acidocella aquatica]